MIYGNPPFHGISGGAMVKMQVIGSGQHVIEFPERIVSKITEPSDGRVVSTQQVSIPYSARHTMRSCLSYEKESRLTIEELLAHNFLKSGHDSGKTMRARVERCDTNMENISPRTQQRSDLDDSISDAQISRPCSQGSSGRQRRRQLAAGSHQRESNLPSRLRIEIDHLTTTQLMFNELRSQYETAFGKRSV
jgi:serine/threonine protein kinase